MFPCLSARQFQKHLVIVFIQRFVQAWWFMPLQQCSWVSAGCHGRVVSRSGGHGIFMHRWSGTGMCTCISMYVFVFVSMCFCYVFAFVSLHLFMYLFVSLSMYFFLSICLSIHQSVFVCPLVFSVHLSMPMFPLVYQHEMNEIINFSHFPHHYDYDIFVRYHFRCMYVQNIFIHSKIHYIIFCPFPSNDFVILWKKVLHHLKCMKPCKKYYLYMGQLPYQLVLAGFLNHPTVLSKRSPTGPAERTPKPEYLIPRSQPT